MKILSTKKSNIEDRSNKRVVKRQNEEFPLQEYRLVPIEDLDAGKPNDDSGINLAELTIHIWRKRKFVMKVVGVFFAIGLLISLLSPVEYQTETTLMPEIQNQQGEVGNLLQRYGGLLGIGNANLNAAGGSTISPQLYPKIFQSLLFQMQLLNQQVYFERYDTTTTIFTFFNEIYTPSIFTYMKKYTFGLGGLIKKRALRNLENNELTSNYDSTELIYLTKRQKEIIEDMRERVYVKFDEESGTINILSEMPDAYAAAQIGKKAVDLLTKYLIDYRTQKAMIDLKFVQEQCNKAQVRFQESQTVLAKFRDRNKNLATSTAQTEIERLQNERDLTFNIYNVLAQQLEQAKIKVQEQTPVFKVLQPVHIPLDKSSPHRVLILFVSIFLGLIISVSYLVIRAVYRNIA